MEPRSRRAHAHLLGRLSRFSRNERGYVMILAMLVLVALGMASAALLTPRS